MSMPIVIDQVSDEKTKSNPILLQLVPTKRRFSLLQSSSMRSYSFIRSPWEASEKVGKMAKVKKGSVRRKKILVLGMDVWGLSWLACLGLPVLLLLLLSRVHGNLSLGPRKLVLVHVDLVLKEVDDPHAPIHRILHPTISLH